MKKQLAEAPILQHYDPTRALSLAMDASPYRCGAVLCHVLDDGTEKPTVYASRTLNAVEKIYSQRGLGDSVWSDTFLSISLWTTVCDCI